MYNTRGYLMPKIFYGILFAILLIVLVFTFTNPSKNNNSTEEPQLETSTQEEISKTTYPLIVLDAGHGGFDPGKVGINGVLEKDINLAIVMKLKELLENHGFTIHLTRDSDQLLAAPNSSSQKKDDMIARIEMIAELNPFFTISIHQNSFTSPNTSGPQVFYYKDSIESATMAQVIQDIMNDQLKPEKNRQAQANTNYYLLTRTPTPTVIVECGFLSNQTEADLLAQDSYQNQVAYAIFSGIVAYYEATTSNQTPSE